MYIQMDSGIDGGNWDQSIVIGGNASYWGQI